MPRYPIEDLPGKRLETPRHALEEPVRLPDRSFVSSWRITIAMRKGRRCRDYTRADVHQQAICMNCWGDKRIEQAGGS